MNLSKRIKEEMILAVGCFAAFTFGIPCGFLAYPSLADRVPGLMDAVFSGILSGTDSEKIFNVFIHNTRATLILLLLGITIVGTLSILWLNGFFIALVMSYSHEAGMPWSTMVSGLVLHGIFELPALFIASAMGIRVGLDIVRGKGRRRAAGWAAFKDAIKAYVIFVIPLMAIAAVLEILVSAKLVS